jgi:hypothetical protein
VVAVLSRPRTATAESGFHFALPAGAGQTFAAMLAAETPDRVPAPDVLAMDNHGNDDQDHKKCSG